MNIDRKSFSNSSDNIKGFTNEAKLRLCHRLRFIGVSVSILLLWNGVCDFIYGYSSKLSGLEYFSPAVWDTIRTAGHRPYWLVMIAQTAGWLYPFYALSYYHWWVGMRRAGFWLAHVPRAMLACPASRVSDCTIWHVVHAHSLSGQHSLAVESRLCHYCL